MRKFVFVLAILWPDLSWALTCSGVDDTAAIQNAVDLGDVKLDGQCRINGLVGIRIPSNRTVDATGATVSQIPGCTYRCKALETISDATDITIRGGEYIGDMSPMCSSCWRIGIRVDKAKRVRIEGVTLRDWFFDGIWVGGNTQSEDVLIRDVEIRNFHRNGMSVVNANRVWVEHSTIADATLDALVGAGIDVEPNPGDRVDGMHTAWNRFVNVKVGIFDQPGRGTWGTEHSHTYNVFEQFRTHGLIVNSHRYVLAYGNTFHGAGIGMSVGGATEAVRAAYVVAAHNRISATRPLVRAGVRDSWFLDNDLTGGRMETVALGAMGVDYVQPLMEVAACQ